MSPFKIAQISRYLFRQIGHILLRNRGSIREKCLASQWCPSILPPLLSCRPRPPSSPLTFRPSFSSSSLSGDSACSWFSRWYSPYFNEHSGDGLSTLSIVITFLVRASEKDTLNIALAPYSPGSDEQSKTLVYLPFTKGSRQATTFWWLGFDCCPIVLWNSSGKAPWQRASGVFLYFYYSCTLCKDKGGTNLREKRTKYCGTKKRLSFAPPLSSNIVPI